MVPKNKTIGPYARIAGSVAASYYAGPLGAAGFQAYVTRLDRGSIWAAIKAGVIAGATSYIGEKIVGDVGHAAMGAGTIEAFGAIAEGTVAGALNGAISSTLSGGYPGQGALYGAGYGAAFTAAGEAYGYFSAKVEIAASQLTVAQSENGVPSPEGVQVAAIVNFGSPEAVADAYEAAQIFIPGGGVVRTAERAAANYLGQGSKVSTNEAEIKYFCLRMEPENSDLILNIPKEPGHVHIEEKIYGKRRDASQSIEFILDLN